MKPVEITPASNRPHRDEDDGLTHKIKIGVHSKISALPSTGSRSSSAQSYGSRSLSSARARCTLLDRVDSEGARLANARARGTLLGRAEELVSALEHEQ